MVLHHSAVQFLLKRVKNSVCRKNWMATSLNVVVPPAMVLDLQELCSGFLYQKKTESRKPRLTLVGPGLHHRFHGNPLVPRLDGCQSQAVGVKEQGYNLSWKSPAPLLEVPLVVIRMNFFFLSKAVCSLTKQMWLRKMRNIDSKTCNQCT